MPVDPTISLKVTGGGSGMADSGYAGAAGSNPLALAGNFAETQKKLNDVKLFNQTFAAKKKLGQIMSQSPDIPTAIAKAQADPEVAAFVPDLLGTITATQSAMQSYRGEIQKQTADAFTHGAAMLPGLAIDPKGAKAGINAWLNNIPDPGVKATVSKSMANIMSALDDPSLDAAGRMKAITAAAVGIPGGLEAMKGLYGAQDQIDTGPVIKPGIRSSNVPSIINPEPGSFTPSGNALTKGLPPQLAPANSIPVSGAGTAASGPGAAKPVDTNSPSPQSYFGTPLFDSKTEMKPPAAVQRDVAGNPTGLEGNRAKQLSEAHSGDDLNRFKSAQDTEAQLADVGHDIESLAAGGGFLTPGAGGELRTQVAKFGKMLEDVTGTKLDIDASKIANAEDLMKATNRMTLDFLNSKLGNQREAAETIRNMTDKGMPGINNTLLGSRLMIGMIGALNQRTKDAWRWDEEWAARNNGDLRKSAASFDAKFNAKDYIDKALADLGMNEHGFTSKAALQKALDSGLLTADQADAIRKNKGRIPDDLPKAEGQ